MTNRKLWIVPLLLSAFAVVGCNHHLEKSSTRSTYGAEEPGAASLSPSEADRLRRALVEWFECEECTEGELKAVVAFEQTAVPSLAATLERGPSAAQREELRLHLEQSWTELEEYQREEGVELPDGGYGLPGGREEYVETYMANYVALYRVRAAQALAAIGGERAEEALREAAGADYRDDVQQAVREALGGGEKTPY